MATVTVYAKNGQPVIVDETKVGLYTGSGKYTTTQNPTTSPQNSGSLQRTLPSETGSLANFNSVIRSVADRVQQERPTTEQIISPFSQAGVPLTTPTSINTALGRETERSFSNIQNTFQTSLDLIKEQETKRLKQQQDNLDFGRQMLGLLVSNPTLFGSMTSKDFEDLKQGVISTELIQNISKAAQTPEVVEQKPYTFEAPSSTFGGGVFNPNTGTLTPLSNGQTGTDPITGVATDPSKFINGYNFTSYATDPNWGNAVNNILGKIGKFNTLQDVDTYIKQVSPKSPITSAMVASTSQKYGIPWEMLVAIMQQESNIGVLGVGAKTYNPANVGNTDSGATRNWGSWQGGLDALGQNIAKRQQQVITTNEIDPTDFDDPEFVKTLPISELTKAIISGYGTTKDLTPTDKSKVIQELYQVGFDPKTYILDKLDNLAKMYGDIPSGARGIIQGRYPASPIPSASAFETTKIVLTRQIARLFDVGMLSDQDVASYKEALPSRTDFSQKTVNAKIEALKKVIGIGKKSENIKNQTQNQQQSQPQQMQLPNGTIVNLQSDGTYQ